MRKYYIFLLFIFIFTANIFGTVQQSDYIIYNGIKYYLDYENPMEEYFKKFPFRLPKSNIISTNLWRGYIATFEIIDYELWVIDVEILGESIEADELISVKNKSFNGKDKLKLDWFSGLLALSQSIYSNEIEYYNIIEIEKGNIILEYELINEQYFKYLRLKTIIDSGVIVDELKIWDEIFEKNVDLKDTDEFTRIYNELYKKYSEPLDYEKLIYELNEGTMPNELVNYLIKYIQIKKEVEKNSVGQYSISLLMLILIIFGIIIISCFIIFIIINKRKVCCMPNHRLTRLFNLSKLHLTRRKS
jgi:hypothetical protein